MPEWLTLQNITAVVTAFISLFSVVAAITPTKADNQILDKLIGLVNVFAVNVGGATPKK
jgi:hypothetical protein